MLIIKYIGLLLITLGLIGCNPFSKTLDDNQFVVKRERLVFMGHKLGHWGSKAIPQCTLCSLSIYTIKLASDVMLFKQINDERGDLFFLAAREVHSSFAMKTGVYSYLVTLKIEEGNANISIDKQPPFTLVIGQKQKVSLAGNNYFVELQLIDNKYDSIDLNIWSESAVIVND